MDGGPFAPWPGEFPAALKEGQLLIAPRQPGEAPPPLASQAAYDNASSATDAADADRIVAAAGGSGDGGGDNGEELVSAGLGAGEASAVSGISLASSADSLSGRVVQSLQISSAGGGGGGRGLQSAVPRILPGTEYRFCFCVLVAQAGGAETATARAPAACTRVHPPVALGSLFFAKRIMHRCLSS